MFSVAFMFLAAARRAIKIVLFSSLFRYLADRYAGTDPSLEERSGSAVQAGPGPGPREDERRTTNGGGWQRRLRRARRLSRRARRRRRRRRVEAEKQSVEKGIDAWKKLVASNQTEWAPRRELARVYKEAERWNNFIEVMKEAVDKVKWASPEDKIPVLREMIEVYRDRLKLDVMVVNAFNQILTIQPNNFEAADELAAQYETMKRWPDLISLLRKKAAVVEAPAEKVALQLRIANLFLEKFSNQAEAIKAFEAILEIDPENADALAFVKQMYEKRRDWEKLVAVNQREIEKITDADVRRGRRVEVAKLASEKMKKAAVSIDLWQKVLADDAENVEALGELEKLYEREKMWNELGAVLERQVAAASDAARRSAIYVKLGVLYTEKVQNVAQATTAWQALLQRGAGQPARAGRAQEALSPAEGLERAGAVLRRAGEVGRAGARARAAGRVRGRRRARRPLEQDRRALSRSPAEGAIGRRRPTRRCCRSTARTCRPRWR